MAEFSGVTQTVPDGGTIVFSNVNVPCVRGLIEPNLGTGNIEVKGTLQNGQYPVGCCRKKVMRNSVYRAVFGANVAIPEGGTVGEISLVLTVEGGPINISTMRSTPTATQAFNNVNRSVAIPILGGCCQTIAVKNTSGQAITVSEPVIDIIPY